MLRPMAFKPRDVLPSTAFTLPARYYTDATLFDRDVETFFRRMWVCVGRLEEIPLDGSFITRDLGGDNLILLRTGAGDNVRAFHNLCRHRGTRLCAERDGRLQGSIQCPYHAWTYGFDGQLIGAPHMDGSPGFSRADFPLLACRAEVWDGHIFVCLDDSAPDLATQLADLPPKFAPWQIGRLRRGARREYDVAANWKLIVQNYNECLHCPNLHPQLNQLSHYLSGENEPLRRTYMGGRMDLNDGVQTMSADGLCRRDYLPGLSDGDRRRVYYYSVFPNLLLAPHPDYVMTHTLWPLAPNRTRVVCEWHFHPDQLNAPGFVCDDVTEFWDMTNRQDWHVCELAQAGTSSRAYQPGPYSSREDLLYAFDRFILESLGEPQ
jgi:Rieske 2Fe-2S family protein